MTTIDNSTKKTYFYNLSLFFGLPASEISFALDSIQITKTKSDVKNVLLLSRYYSSLDELDSYETAILNNPDFERILTKHSDNGFSSNIAFLKTMNELVLTTVHPSDEDEEYIPRTRNGIRDSLTNELIMNYVYNLNGRTYSYSSIKQILASKSKFDPFDEPISEDDVRRLRNTMKDELMYEMQFITTDESSTSESSSSTSPPRTLFPNSPKNTQKKLIPGMNRCLTNTNLMYSSPNSSAGSITRPVNIVSGGISSNSESSYNYMTPIARASSSDCVIPVPSRSNKRYRHSTDNGSF